MTSPAPESSTPPDVLEVWAVIAYALQTRSNCLLFGKHSAEEMWLALLATLAAIRDDYATYRKAWAKASGQEALAEFTGNRKGTPSKQQRIKKKGARRPKV